MTHGLIEVGGRLGQETKGREVEKLTVSLSSPNHIVVGSQIPNKLHPANIVDAQFSAYFQLAHAWLYGSDTGIEFSKRLDDEGIHKLSDKIECVKDDSVKGFGSKLRVQYSDGETKQVDIPFPLGEPEHPFSRDRVEAKYFSLVTPVLGEGKAKNLKNLVENLESHSVSELLQLVS
jgi:2-methylcitrate dehydratase PrpD